MPLITIPARLLGTDANTGSAKGASVGSAITLTAAGSRIITFYNDAYVTEQAFLDKDGKMFLAGGLYNDASHGNLGGGSLHALASQTTHGFLSASDKVKLDSLGAGVSDTFTSTCTAGEAIGDIVYANSTGDVVRQATCTDNSKLPAVGIVIAKADSTTATVQYRGVITIFTGLTAGATYAVGVNGALTLIPSGTPGQKLYYQAVGIALDTDKLLLNPSTTIVGFVSS